MLAAVTVTLPNIGEGEAIVSVEKSLFISIVFKLKIFVLANTGGGDVSSPCPSVSAATGWLLFNLCQ